MSVLTNASACKCDYEWCLRLCSSQVRVCSSRVRVCSSASVFDCKCGRVLVWSSASVVECECGRV